MTFKPPLGVIPKEMWLEARIKDLLESIDRYITEPQSDLNPTLNWASELRENLIELRDTRLANGIRER